MSELVSHAEIPVSVERETNGVDLYHVTGWEKTGDLEPGDVFKLNPGPQGAQGKGVYFSEEEPRFSAAEGAKGNPIAVIHIKGGLLSEGWYRSKAAHSRKFGYPRTRHTKGQSIELRVLHSKKLENGIVQLDCDYELVPAS